MKKFHIVITEKKEGKTKTIFETDASGIIGAINQGGGTVAAVSLVNGELTTILETLNGLEEVKKRMYADHPELKLAELLVGIKIDKTEEAYIDDDTEEDARTKDEPVKAFEEPELEVEAPAKTSKCNLKNLFKKGDK